MNRPPGALPALNPNVVEFVVVGECAPAFGRGRLHRGAMHRLLRLGVHQREIAAGRLVRKGMGDRYLSIFFQGSFFAGGIKPFTRCK